MTTIDLTEQNFSQVVGGSDIVLIDFWASWCGPCRQFAPIYDEVSNANPDLTFAKVDTEAEQGLAGAAQITSIPTIMIIREGIPVFSQAGALPKDALEDVISQARTLDMEAVRAQVAEAQQQEGQQAPSRAQAPANEQTAPAPEQGRPQPGNTPGVDYPDENGAIV